MSQFILFRNAKFYTIDFHRVPVTQTGTPGFAPDHGSNAISLHRARVGGTPRVLNEIITLPRTQSHLIAIGVDRPLKARAPRFDLWKICFGSREPLI